MSICTTCKLYRDTWSEKLRNDYKGCIFLVTEEASLSDDIDDILLLKMKLEADEICTGWILNNGMAINNMIITKNTTQCLKYRKE